jgi:hypothetical protein
MRQVEQLFERTLWQSRLVVIIAVVASVLVSIDGFFITTVDDDTQDLLFLAIGILLIGGALYLTQHRASKDHYS